MNNFLTIENATGDSKIVFGKVSKEYLEVTIETPKAFSHSTVFMYTDIPLLIALFKDISANWRGWEGVKKFCSVERDFCIEATHNGTSCVYFKILLCAITDSGVESETKVGMNIECGGLDSIANRVEKYFSQNP